MPSVLERLRAALAPGIAVDRELARGGMGVVFLGRDTVLDRQVAIKTLAPERATAVLAERFVREARSTARITHPNIVRVHAAGEADGIPYYVMDYFPGGTLKDRLARGVLSPRQVVRVGRDILAGLGAAHRKKIVHRDVKPGNIFLSGGRALLADFGVAYLMDSAETALTETGVPVGTPGYMAPEQLQDVEVTASADLYAVGLVLLESCTGERWDQRTPLESARLWSAVPPPLREPLGRALHADPARRWRDADAFAEALAATDVGARREALRTRGLAGLVGAALIALGLLGYRLWPVGESSPHPETRVTVFPFDAAVPGDSGLSTEVSGFAAFYLERLPGVVLTHLPAAARAWHSSELPHGERLARLTSGRFRTSYGVWGALRRRGAALEAQVQVVDSSGAPRATITVSGDSADRWGLGDSVGAHFVRTVLPRHPGFRKAPVLGDASPAAYPMFFEGERAFARGAWLQAERQYAAALAADSGFVLAAWRLGNVRRWLVIDPAFPADFARMYRGDSTLPEADRRLIEAQLAPTAGQRFRIYDDAMESTGGDAYAALLYGDELFHRGPLAGRPLSEAVGVLRRATAADPSFAPAWEHLAWAFIRLGQRAPAETALVHLRRTAGRAEEYRYYLPPLLAIAHAVRFGKGESVRPDTLLRSPDALALAARGGLAFDIPEAERMLGAALAAGPAPASQRASGRTAEALALMALGRADAALARFDAAASLSPRRLEGRLHAAEWRVIPAALGVPGISARHAQQGRGMLEVLADDIGVGHRAAWALALDALARGDSASARVWTDRVRNSRAAGALMPVLEGFAIASGGDLERAVLALEPATAYDSAGLAPDPFLRSAVHLARGDWLARLGRLAEADRDLLWYENTDLVGWPEGDAQPAEVDWALSTYARWRRAELARARGNRTAGCRLVERVAEIWARPEGALDSLVRAVRGSAAQCRR